jgi:hypothetical protein
MRLLVLFGVAAFIFNGEWHHWERLALILGVAVGAFSYFVQRKGFTHHRYTLVAFVLLWFAIEFSVAARKTGRIRTLGLAGLALMTLVLVPRVTLQVRAAGDTNAFAQNLEADLTAIGVDRLQRNVQCLDLVDGCLNALYHLKIVQSTGLTGDILLFAPDSAPIVQQARQAFWRAVTAAPPEAIVLSNESFLSADFNKLRQWPQFAQYLDASYNLYVERTFDQISASERLYASPDAR